MRPRFQITPIAVVLALLSACQPVASAEKVKVHGKLVDERGKPVKDLELGVAWAGSGKSLTPQTSMVVAKDGGFTGEIDVDREKSVAFLAFDKLRRKGGVAVIANDDLENEIKVIVDTLVTVSGMFDVSNLREAPETVVLNFTSADKAPVLQIEVDARRKFTFKMPAGKYELSLACAGGEREPRAIAIAPGKANHDLGKLPVHPVTQQHAKQSDAKSGMPSGAARAAPPLNVSDALPANLREIKLSNYKGKWVLLEFWGYW